MRKIVYLFACFSLTVAAAIVFASSAVGSASATPPPSRALSASFESVLTIDGRVVAHRKLVVPDGQGPTGQSLHCNIVNNFYDGDGTYSVQHTCGGTTAAWVYLISGAACSTAAGPVNEAGQIWALQGKTMPMQSPHPGVPCNYRFHGTYRPFHDLNNVAYSDVITWITKTGGRAQLQYYGHFSISGSPCSPTSC